MGGVSFMEQVVVEKSGTRFIYLIKDNNIQFYLIIPNNNKVSMVLNIMENVGDERVKKIVEFNDKVLVIPVLNSSIISYLKNDSLQYNQADNYFSNLINKVYNILAHNNITVNNKVYLNNDLEFSGFNNYFVNKFKGRVDLISLELNGVLDKNEGSIFQTPSVLDSIYNEDISTTSKNPEMIGKNHEPGFVSYVLLGVFVAILSLVFLYMIL